MKSSLFTEVTETLKAYLNIVVLEEMSNGDVCVLVEEADFEKFNKISELLKANNKLYVVPDSFVYSVYVSPGYPDEVTDNLSEVVTKIMHIFEAPTDINVPLLQKLFRRYCELKQITSVKRIWPCRTSVESIDEFTAIGWLYWQQVFQRTCGDNTPINGEYTLDCRHNY